ncbi:MAG: SUMF1/EgtB/PvdO family nonheme iron enzyme [Deltaproteobacteria bacterium]|nr:SUMF1/EgtB/PvdO family nonheme iron enzyme [Deltaproteobacteria bacterium]
MRNRYLFCAILVSSFLFLGQALVFGSHLEIGKVSLSEIHPRKKYGKIQFNVSWDKAWKNEVNCDGVWVFAKYRIGDGLWKHATLKSASARDFNYTDQTPKYFSKGSSEEIGMWVPDTKKGAFLFRTKGAGSVASRNVQLVWDYRKDKVKDDQATKTAVKVFGVEMVYVPQDNHYVGDPRGASGPDNCFYTYPDGGAYLVKSEAPITVKDSRGSLYCEQDNPRSRDDTPFVIPKAFPKGHKAFWCMKYELSSRQYVDFLNSLTRKQQQSRVDSDISGDSIDNYYVMNNKNVEYLRQSIVCAKKGNGVIEPVTFYTYAPARACNFISWADLTSYADWAGLRPITELEYEKACRGPEKAVPEEYAWGVEAPGRVDTFDGADGSGFEKKVPQTGVVNCCFHGGVAPFEEAAGKTVRDNPGFEGPVSIGLFENTQHEGVSKRLNDGASYYGIMELSGNLWERCVTIGHPKGRGFEGSRGDGELDEEGYADVPDWPGKDGAGAGNRGGVWSSPAGKYLLVGLRFAASNPREPKGKNSGIRLGF